MKLGFSELLLVLAIIAVILLVLRGMSIPNSSKPPPATVRHPTAAEIEESRIQSSRRSRLTALGGVFLVTGLIILASTLKMFDLILSWYAGGVLVIIAGVAVLFLSARR